MKPILAIFLALLPTLLWARCDTISLSLGEALHIAQQHNHSLAIANLAVEGASAQRAEIESFWFPTINLSGEYIHSLSEIAVESTLGQIEGQITDDIKLIAATNPALGQIVSALEGSTFRLPLTVNDDPSVRCVTLECVAAEHLFKFVPCIAGQEHHCGFHLSSPSGALPKPKGSSA